MKITFIVILCGILSISCSKNDELDMSEFPQKWELVKMTGSIPNSETTGDEMEWQEFYIFNQDNSFIKNRERDGSTTEVSGTYELIEDSTETVFKLSFTTDNMLIGNCVQETIETLILINPNLIRGTWEACDGPGLEYERTE